MNNTQFINKILNYIQTDQLRKSQMHVLGGYTGIPGNNVYISLGSTYHQHRHIHIYYDQTINDGKWVFTCREGVPVYSSIIGTLPNHHIPQTFDSNISEYTYAEEFFRLLNTCYQIFSSLENLNKTRSVGEGDIEFGKAPVDSYPYYKKYLKYKNKYLKLKYNLF